MSHAARADEALSTLYPTCSPMLAPSPICNKAERNIGLVRSSVFVGGPFIIALLLSIALHCCVDHNKQRIATEERLKARDRRVVRAVNILYAKSKQRKKRGVAPAASSAARTRTEKPETPRNILQQVVAANPDEPRPTTPGLQAWPA
jgi:hypothetical protein